MESDKRFDDMPVKTSILIRLAIDGLQRNPVVSLSGQRGREQTGSLVIENRTAQLAIRNWISQSSRIMAWDSLHLFGPCQEDRSSAEKNDLEGE